MSSGLSHTVRADSLGVRTGFSWDWDKPTLERARKTKGSRVARAVLKNWVAGLGLAVTRTRGKQAACEGPEWEGSHSRQQDGTVS